MRARTKSAAFAVVVAALLAACGTDAEPEPLPSLPTVGEIYQLLLDSPAEDGDGDGLPDAVERDPRVGTDPARVDSDGDGRSDCFEVFGRSFIFVMTDGQAGELHEGDPLLDNDGDGMTAPVDPAELCDEYMVDSDLDGVYDYLEYYGYVYDWPKAKFVAWTEADRQASPDTPWYQTDPLQYSTDQDAYSDGMEVSGVRMDVAVRDPGRDPLVPAYPNIVVRLFGYAVTLNEDVTYERGGGVSREDTWSRQTEGSRSFGWSTGGEAGIETGAEGKNFKFLVHYNQSWGIQGTNTSSTTIAVGSTINEEINWNTARCHNATEAAHIRLFLKVENCGTAPASNLIPTVSLRIGGANVATFQQPDFAIHMLMPGETFPAEADVYWVVDSTAQGPLALTEHELKALEEGAPIGIAVPQLSADVMRLGEGGGWESTGDVNEYTARCEAVGANLFADLGKGAFLHQRVYAGQGVTAPPMTLGEALRRTFGATENDGEWTLEYVDGDGVRRTADLSFSHGDGWTIHIDPDTFERIEEGQDPFDVGLTPDSHIELIPPRDEENPWPTIFSAYATPLDQGYDVVVCACDYDGIEKVEFVDRDGVRTEMKEDGRGPWFFSCRVPDDYDFTDYGIETVEVTSTNPDVPVAIRPVAVVYTVESIPPLITRILFDANRGMLKAKVEAGGDLPQDAIDWVRVYHDDFRAAQTNEDRDGYVTMEETVNWFEDPSMYECKLPNDVVPDRARIVAKTAGGLYAASGVAGMDTIQPWRADSKEFYSRVRQPAFVGPWYDVPRLDADTGWKSDKVFQVANQNPWDWKWEIDADWQQQVEADGSIDVYYCSNLADGSGLWWYPYVPYFGFPHGAALLDTSQSEKSPMTQYLELGRNDIESMIDSGTIELVTGELWPFHVDSVFILQTSQGRYGKFIVTSYQKGGRNAFDAASTAVAEYVIFRKPGDYSGPPPPIAYHEPAPYYEVGRKISPNWPIAQASGEWPDRYYLVSHVSLPKGLELAPGSGVITGTPTASSDPTAYVIAASNPAGTTYCTVTIAVRQPPGDLAYTFESGYDIGEWMSVQPTWNGDASRFQIAPALPEGLTLYSDGVISGTPTEVTGATTYTVTASNETGASTSTTVEFATLLVAPHGLAYGFQASYVVGDEILEASAEMPTLDNPVVEGLDDYPLTYSFKSGGTRPGDFTIDPATGAVWGALDTAGTYTFTIVVENGKGSDEHEVTLTVDPPP